MKLELKKIKNFLNNHLADVLNIIIASITLWVAIITLNVAQNAYKHDGEDYRANIIVEKNDNFIHIKNQDEDLFDIESICVEKRDRYRVQYENEKTYVDFLSMYHYKDITENEVDSLNDVQIDTDVLNSYSSENDIILYENMYEITLKHLQERYNISYRGTLFYITVEYFNKHTYEDDILELMAYIEDDGSIKRFYPRKDDYISIALALEYDFIKDILEDYIKDIDIELGISERRLTIGDEIIDE